MADGQQELFPTYDYGHTHLLEFVESPGEEEEVSTPPRRLAELAIGPEFVGSEQGAKFWDELVGDIRPALGP